MPSAELGVLRAQRLQAENSERSLWALVAPAAGIPVADQSAKPQKLDNSEAVRQIMRLNAVA